MPKDNQYGKHNHRRDNYTVTSIDPDSYNPDKDTVEWQEYYHGPDFRSALSSYMELTRIRKHVSLIFTRGVS